MLKIVKQISIIKSKGLGFKKNNPLHKANWPLKHCKQPPKGNEIDCCDKKGFITESILTTIKKSNLSSDLFSYTSLENFSINDYDFKGYTINERYKYHPYYSFSIDFDVYFILNKNCDNSIDITLIKEVC